MRSGSLRSCRRSTDRTGSRTRSWPSRPRRSARRWRASPSAVGQLVERKPLKAPYPEPSPQSNAYWKPAEVSAEDGSNGLVSESAIGEPSFTDDGALKVAVGATFDTVTVVWYSEKPPSLSMIRARTVKLPLSLKVQVVEALVPEPA